jgi:hypothetical protein
MASEETDKGQVYSSAFLLCLLKKYIFLMFRNYSGAKEDAVELCVAINI